MSHTGDNINLYAKLRFVNILRMMMVAVVIMSFWGAFQAIYKFVDNPGQVVEIC